MLNAIAPAISVVHIVARDIQQSQIETLSALLAAERADDSPRVIHLGSGAAPDLPRLTRVRVPFDAPWLAVRALQRSIGDSSGRAGDDKSLLLHAWSAGAAAVCSLMLNGSRERGGALLECGSGADAATLARWMRMLGAGRPMLTACATATSERRLVEHGAAADRCVTIRRSVDYAALGRANRAATRARLDLGDLDEVVLALPPVDCGAGSFLTIWAVLLAERIRPRVRLIVPGRGREVDRIRHLVRSCDRGHVLRTTGDAEPLAELLAAADVAAYLPDRDAHMSGAMWAMASGTPLLGSAVPCVAEMLQHGQNALLCRPNDPRDAARRLLTILEDRHAAQRRAEVARGQAFSVFSRQRMIEQYARLYANLAGGRPAREEIRDAAFVE